MYDDFIVCASTVYTSPDVNDILGQTEKIAFQVVTDQVTVASGIPQLALDLEHSSDQRNCSTKSATVGATTLSLDFARALYCAPRSRQSPQSSSPSLLDVR